MVQSGLGYLSDVGVLHSVTLHVHSVQSGLGYLSDVGVLHSVTLHGREWTGISV